MEKQEMEQHVNFKVVRLVLESFEDDSDALQIGMYILACVAIAEIASSGVIRGVQKIECQPHLLDLMWRYDSALVDNDLYLKNYAVFKGMTTLDRVKSDAIMRLTTMAEEHDDQRMYKGAKNMLLGAFDSLIVLAYIYKGYDFAIDFACKLHSLMRLTPEIKRYFDERITD